MNFENIFTVRNDDLGRLGSTEAVQFFRELLGAEARRLGIEISKIYVPIQTDVPDGGVDAVVIENGTSAASGLIKTGQTSYQIKSGQSFSPWQKSEIRKELFGERTTTK